MASSRSVEESGQDEAVSPDADRRLRFALLEAAGGPSMGDGERSRLEQVAPGMKLVTVAGVGHAPELSEPEAVAAIDQFLEDLAKSFAA